jgi:hypothetical protein
MAYADGTVLPKPGIPKTLGILNVIFGVLMVLYGLCILGTLVAAPAGMAALETMVKDVQAKSEAQQKANLKTIDDRAKAATTEEEKKAIQQEREAVIASTPPVVKVDMSPATDVLKNPVVMGFSFLQMGTGVILSVILLVAGIGLIRLAPWGRTISIAWAGLQILQLVVLTAASILYVQPIARENQEKMLTKMEAEAKGPNAAPGAAESVKMARAMSSPAIANASIIGYLVCGSIYPVVVLILLNNRGARAALLGPKPDGRADF